MNSKESKKIRKLYRKEYSTLAQEQSKLVRDIFKPKPKWIPWKVWRFFLSFFIKIK